MTLAESVEPLRVRGVAALVGLTLDESTVTALTVFGDLFLLWNGKLNLGGRIGATELVERHYLDAFAAARFVAPTASVVDVGSGGGLPAIPLALVRPLGHFELYEPTGKKVTFLRTALRTLRLGARVAVRAQRIDGLREMPEARFDVAMSRATLAPDAWLKLGQHLILPTGRVLVFGTDEEVPGLPTAREVVSYAPNRRLLMYERV